MANLQLSPPDTNFTNSLRAVPDQLGSNSGVGNANNYSSISAMRTRLAAANAAYYTSARLDSLTVNDMVFALRNIDDPTTIASYMTASAA